MYVKLLITQLFLFASLVLAKTRLVSSCNIANNTSDIVVAGGSITEILYFLNEEDRILGVDVTSNFPEETSELPSIG